MHCFISLCICLMSVKAHKVSTGNVDHRDLFGLELGLCLIILILPTAERRRRRG